MALIFLRMEKIEQIVKNRGYFISKEGIFYNPRKEIIGTTTSSIYIRSSVRVNGKKVTIQAHRLQAYQKFGEKLYEKNILVRHLDGNPINNAWNNILIGTSSQNRMDIPSNIRIKSAQIATSYIRKYNKIEVKEFHSIEKSYNKTMKKFNITSKGTLNYILNN